MADSGSSIKSHYGDRPVSLCPLSQSQVNVLTHCPRQFQYQFLEQRSLPASPDFLDAMEWGQRFHRLIERHILGLSIEPWLEGDRELAVCFNALKDVLAETFPSCTDPSVIKLCEHRRSLQMGAYLLTAVYDLLVLERGRSVIIDWKTAARPRNRSDLENDWQTKLYLYLLAETSDQPADSLSMVYWFVRTKELSKVMPSTVQFNYTASWHQKTQEELIKTLDQLTVWREAFLKNRAPFPKKGKNGDDKGSHNNDSENFLDSNFLDSNSTPLFKIPSWETIPEIKLDNL